MFLFVQRVVLKAVIISLVTECRIDFKRSQSNKINKEDLLLFVISGKSFLMIFIY